VFLSPAKMIHFLLFRTFLLFEGEELNKKTKRLGIFKKIVPKKETIVDTLRTAHVSLRLSRDSISFVAFRHFSEYIYRFG